MLSQGLIKDFQKIVGPNLVFTAETDRHTYSYDAAVAAAGHAGLGRAAWHHGGHGPGRKTCNDNSLPLTVRGAGTNLSGAPFDGRRRRGFDQRP